jgi:hypothetical protein
MPSDRKQTAPLYIPHFTAANYGSFFLAGQRCSRLLVIQELSDLIPKGHFVRRMFVSQTRKRQSIFMVFVPQKANSWRHDPYARLY